MIEQIINQFVIAFDPWMLVVCLLGVSLGILWGAMPGLSTTMAMALLIGLSVGMSQYVAIMFMVYDFSSPLPMPRRIRQSPSANTNTMHTNKKLPIYWLKK